MTYQCPIVLPSNPVVQPDGTRVWWRIRKMRDKPVFKIEMHRTDGPAIIYPDGTQMWYRKGLRHHHGAPAVIWANGALEWWVDGVFIHRREAAR